MTFHACGDSRIQIPPVLGPCHPSEPQCGQVPGTTLNTIDLFPCLILKLLLEEDGVLIFLEEIEIQTCVGGCMGTL